MSCKDHFIWDNKCEYCGRPACELGKKDHFIWDNKCEYCGLPACELGKKDHFIWNNKCEYCGLPACELNDKNYYRCRCCRRRLDCTCESESTKKKEEGSRSYNNDCIVF